MTPKFSEAVDPVFEYVLDLLDQIERRESVRPEQEHERIRRLLDQGAAKLGESKEWELARYGLCAWIDEMLILEAPWSADHREWWNNNSLESHLFGARLRWYKYYMEAKQAAELPRRDALEVFYLGVVLGFRGLYRDANDHRVTGASPDQLGAQGDEGYEPAYMNRLEVVETYQLPPDLDAWIKRTASAIKVGGNRPPIIATGKVGPGAPPLRGQAWFVVSCLAAVLLGGVALMVGVFPLIFK